MRAHRTALLCLLSLLPTSALAETRTTLKSLLLET
jgi:hypothetical protein